MKLLIIRHGEPDYESDCLTANGILQAKKLAARLETENITAAYMSPMGRARETAEICVKGKDIPLTQCDWLHEFDVKVRDIDKSEPVHTWDICPKNWTSDDSLYDREKFFLSPGMQGSGIKERFDAVCAGLDLLLADYGLVREGGVYRKTSACNETLALFCHFGATCVIIAHLLGISPIVALQGFSAEPTAIAALCTDDRFGELVNFRLHGFGDINHLGNRGAGIVNYQ